MTYGIIKKGYQVWIEIPKEWKIFKFVKAL